jgi:hypothetical protein
VSTAARRRLELERIPVGGVVSAATAGLWQTDR